MNKDIVHIVIGAGAGGCLCSQELTKKGKVLLFDIGGLNNDEITSNPLNWGTAFSRGNNTIHMKTISQNNLHSRQISYSFGQSIGGSTNINAMIWTGGHSEIFNQYWPKEWSSKRFTSLLKKVQAIIKPHRLSASKSISSVINSVKPFKLEKKSSVLKIKNNNNNNNDHSVWCESISQDYHYTTISKSNLRLSLYNQILEPLIHQNRLELYRNMEVETILLQHISNSNNLDVKYCAIGIIVIDHVNNVRKYYSPKNNGEIVLCCGAIYSPFLLSRSIIIDEIFPIHSLESYGNNRVKNEDLSTFLSILSSSSSPSSFSFFSLPDIGSRLLDHTILPYIGIGNWWNQVKKLKLQQTDIYDQETNNYPPNSIHGWIFLDKNGEIISNPKIIPSVQLVFVDGRILCGSMFPEMILPHYSIYWYENYLRPILFNILQMITSLSLIKWLLSCVCGVLICSVQPTIKPGHILLPNPSSKLDSIKIDPQYGTSLEDIELLWKSLKFTRQIISQSSKSFYFLELLPGPLFLYCFNLLIFTFFYRQFLGSYFHYCGTNFMTSSTSTSIKSNSDSNSNFKKFDGVVNEELKVHSVKSLRIADASIFPAIPSAPISAIVMSIGLAVGELINNK